MKAEYKKLGKYIQPVDVRNIDFKRSEFEMFKKDGGNKCHTDWFATNVAHFFCVKVVRPEQIRLFRIKE